MSEPPERRNRQRVKPQVGDLFAIDLVDGSWGLGHIVASEGKGADTCYVLFAKPTGSVAELPAHLDEVMRAPVGVLISNDTEIRRGTWPIVGHREPYYPGISLPKLSGEGATWRTPGVLPGFIEAYNGLRPWDEYAATPTYYNRILLPHLSVPPAARFRDAFAAPPPVARAVSAPARVTEGPAELTIQIVYPGDGLPSSDLLHRRQEMERRLEMEGVGEVESAESGAGVMTIYLLVDDVRRAVPVVERIAGELGLANDVLIDAAPTADDVGRPDEA